MDPSARTWIPISAGWVVLLFASLVWSVRGRCMRRAVHAVTHITCTFGA